MHAHLSGARCIAGTSMTSGGDPDAYAVCACQPSVVCQCQLLACWGQLVDQSTVCVWAGQLRLQLHSCHCSYCCNCGKCWACYWTGDKDSGRCWPCRVGRLLMLQQPWLGVGHVIGILADAALVIEHLRCSVTFYESCATTTTNCLGNLVVLN